MQGWIKIPTDEQDFLPKSTRPHCWLGAWVDLLMLAADAEPTGTIVTSLAALGKRWKWSSTQVRNFLKHGEKHDRVTIENTMRNTIVTITNPALYLGSSDFGENEKHDGKHDGKHELNTTENTNKKEKIDKKEKNQKKEQTEKKEPPLPLKENPLKGVKEKVPSPPPTDAQQIAQQLQDYTDNPELRQDLNAFLEMRKKIRKPMTPYAVKLMLNKLSGFAKDDKTKSAILQQSIEASWQGIFPLREQTQTRAWIPQEQQLSPLDRLAHQEIHWEDLEAVE